MHYVKGRGMQFIYKRPTLSSRATESPLERLLSCTCRVLWKRFTECRAVDVNGQKKIRMHPYTHSCTLRMQVLFNNKHLLHSRKKYVSTQTYRRLTPVCYKIMSPQRVLRRYSQNYLCFLRNQLKCIHLKTDKYSNIKLVYCPTSALNYIKSLKS